jgi:NAD(P)-dependent dehydrogenase (short-subunit alcohol dehydrogenase family)
VGDQSVPVKLLFCGIGSSLSDLLDAHHSCYRLASAYVMLADPLSSYVSGATIAVTGGRPFL